MRRRLFLSMAGMAAVTPAYADDLDVIVLGGGLSRLGPSTVAAGSGPVSHRRGLLLRECRRGRARLAAEQKK